MPEIHCANGWERTQGELAFKHNRAAVYGRAGVQAAGGSAEFDFFLAAVGLATRPLHEF